MLFCNPCNPYNKLDPYQHVKIKFFWHAVCFWKRKIGKRHMKAMVQKFIIVNDVKKKAIFPQKSTLFDILRNVLCQRRHKSVCTRGNAAHAPSLSTTKSCAPASPKCSAFPQKPALQPLKASAARAAPAPAVLGQARRDPVRLLHAGIDRLRRRRSGQR